MSRVDMKAAGLVQGPENLLFLAKRTQSRPGTRHILSQGCEERLRPEEQLKRGPARPRPPPGGAHWVGPAPPSSTPPAVALLSWILRGSLGLRPGGQPGPGKQ